MKTLVKFRALLFALGMPSVGYAQDLWHGAQYGMTENEVHSIFPQAHHYKASIPNIEYGGSYIYDNYGWENLSLDGCLLNVVFDFKNKKLDSVHLKTNKISEKKSYCSLSMRRDLVGKYGKPTYIHSGSIISYFYWDIENKKRISIVWSDYPSILTWSSEITYFLKPKSNAKNIL